jgi:zinc transport system substrate-binding protein
MNQIARTPNHLKIMYRFTYIEIITTMIISTIYISACTSNTSQEMISEVVNKDHKIVTKTHQSTTIQAQTSQSKISVLTSLYPLQNLTEYLVKDLKQFNVALISSRDVDLAHFMPNDIEMKALHQADLILLNGAQFENWTSQVSLPLSLVIHTADSFKDQWLQHHQVTHKHGPEGKHTHADIDGHTWLDPILLVKQMQRVGTIIKQRFLAENSKSKNLLDQRMKHLTKELHSLDSRWRELAKSLKDSHIIANHEAYQYLAKRYHINISSLDIDPQEAISNEQQKKIRQLKAEWTSKGDQDYFLWESQASSTHLKRIETLELSNIIFNPLENLYSIQSYTSTIGTNHNGSSLPLYLQVMQIQLSNIQKQVKVKTKPINTTHSTEEK